MSELSTLDEVLNGIGLIRKYEPGASIAAEHDQIYFGSYDTHEQMTPEEREQMEAWNWFEDVDSWSHFV
jgi:hypothetical protein